MRRFDAKSTVMSDFATNGLLMFVMMLALLLPFINDPKQKVDAENVDPPHQGVLRVEVFWPDDQHIDVDLWVKGPVGKAVGYSNKGSELWNLLRDDLGVSFDASKRNMETSYTRGLWDGEYIVNLHLFSVKTVSAEQKNSEGWKDGELPVPCRVLIYFKSDRDAADKQLIFRDLDLKRVGQELTALRFTVKDFQPVMASFHHVQKNIRDLKSDDLVRPEEMQ